MKNNYIAVQIKEGNKFYAYVIEVTEVDNLLSKLNIENIITANIYNTKKKAESVVNHWNACFKANGDYLFDKVF